VGSYDGMVAVVTGGGQGIGESIVRAVVREGGAVVAMDLDEALVASLAAELGDHCTGQPGDVRREVDTARMVEAAVSAYGHVDVGFNVAGATRTRSLLNMTDDDWDFTFQICVRGVLYAMKHEAGHMAATGHGGAIVNIASLNSEVPAFGAAAYCTAKAAVAMMSRCAALEFAEHGIRVNALSPGLVETPGTEFMLRNDLAREALEERIPARRAASAAEIAEAALFLGGPRGSYITGVNLFADGGWALSAYPDLRPAALQRRR
jgi:NAD(P)-dependent dehydrogenase (short-subunit alcohol dehydrogenase family)